MGTDIHTVVQIRKDGVWITLNKRGFFDDRNYNAFAILANVRNGYGFAGIKTGDGWIPISEPKGLPPDFEYNEEYHPKFILKEDAEYDWDYDSEKCHWLGDHSFSYHSLKEIKDYFKRVFDNKTRGCGYITLEQYEKYRKEYKRPQSWSGEVDGPNIIKLTAQKAEEIINCGLALRPDKSFYVFVNWDEDYKDNSVYTELARAF